jgi:chromosome partitioning protein
MKIRTVCNRTCGVGKTTTVVTPEGIPASCGYRAQPVDLDPHGSLISYFRTARAQSMAGLIPPALATA